MFIQDLETADGVKDLMAGSFDAAMDQPEAFLLIKRSVRKEVVHYVGGGLAKGVGKDTVNADPGDGHGVLVAVLLGGTHIGKLEAVPGKFPECADTGRWDKGSLDDIKAE